MASTAFRINRGFNDNVVINGTRGTSIKLTSNKTNTTPVDIQSRKSVFDSRQQNTENRVRRNNSTKATPVKVTAEIAIEPQPKPTPAQPAEVATEPPRASLLKYEVRKLVDLRRVQDKFTTNIKQGIIQRRKSEIANQQEKDFVKGSKITPTSTTQIAPTSTPQVAPTLTPQITSVNGVMTTKPCENCQKLQERLKLIEGELDRERKSNETQNSDDDKFLEFEKQLNETINERDEFSKTIKKLQREIKKLDSNFEEEKMQTRRLGIKLEDANYEIGRLREELIKTQLENEKIIEENEDLAVDNEDLIHERDEIVQIYDELFRESERLKAEVKIWKTVFENNKENLPDDVQQEIQDEEELNKDEEESDEDEVTLLRGASLAEGQDDRISIICDGPKEKDVFHNADVKVQGVVMEIEEDKSLLLPPRDDITMKNADPSKYFDIGDELGRGKFGKVYKAVAKSTGDTYAAKYVKVTSKLREDVLTTVDVMKKLHHQRLMSLFGVYDLGAQIIMILEYVSGGMLFERIVENNSHTEADAILYVKQILQGLHHLHAQHICHLELKPENIACANRNSMEIKLIDFGLAKQLEHKKDIKITAGTPEFVAPEILSFDPVSLGSDMWSVGVIAYVLLSGVSPFIGDDDNDTLLNVSCGEYEYDENDFKNISNDAKEFINALLLSNPKKRSTVSQCLNHSWMKVPPQARRTKINLDKMKTFLEKRKEKHNVSAVRAIRRFSSFGVGPGKLNHRASPMLKAGSSRHLAVPNAMQSSIIAEDEEHEEGIEVNCTYTNGPSLKIIPDSPEQSRRDRTSSSASIPEDTNTPDGLRLYLQRMINEGHLPGGNEAPGVESSEEE